MKITRWLTQIILLSPQTNKTISDPKIKGMAGLILILEQNSTDLEITEKRFEEIKNTISSWKNRDV